ncbi:hypothetical protein D5S17_23875 [Pseudonocardiaceae bacterium YIM PH 21723]|nr:hypothetical protein D5S17_23875 [Pseudonocardiaceae bacterium YIM PH 21723]
MERHPNRVPDNAETGQSGGEQPSTGRMVDYFLGGGYNFAPDRRLAKQAMQHMPDLPFVVHAYRSYVRRAVTAAVEMGVRQFIDLDSSTPTVGSVHEVAHSLDPDCRVVYVNNDLVTVAHCTLILESAPEAIVVNADPCDPDSVLGERTLREFLDLDQPVALILNSVLNHLTDEDKPGALLHRYAQVVPWGSLLIAVHGTLEFQPKAGENVLALYRDTSIPAVTRNRDEFTALLADWELLDPGVVLVPQWRPDVLDKPIEDPERSACYAAVGRRGA